MPTKYIFDEERERLMIANDPEVSSIVVEPINMPNLASRLGRALNQSSHIRDVEIHFDAFENEKSDASVYPILQWIGTRKTLSTLVASFRRHPPTPRSLTLLQWVQEALCNRSLLSLPSLTNLTISYGTICSITFGRLLQVCQPTTFSISSRIVPGSDLSLVDAADHMRNAVSTSSCLRELTVTVDEASAACYCAVFNGLRRNVVLNVSLRGRGRTVAPPQVVETLLPLLENGIISLKTISFCSFSLTEATVAVLASFLRYVQTVEFAHSSFDEASSSHLLSVFDSQNGHSRDLPRKLRLQNVTFPGSAPILEQLVGGASSGLPGPAPIFEQLVGGASSGLQTLVHRDAMPRRCMEGMMAGLQSKSSGLLELQLWRLNPSNCDLLLGTIPLFCKLQSLAFSYQEDFAPYKRAFFLAAKRNGSIKKYTVRWPNMVARDRVRLEHYTTRNRRLPRLLATISSTTRRRDDRHSRFAMLPHLWQVSSDITVATPSHFLSSFLRCTSRVGSYQEHPAAPPNQEIGNVPNVEEQQRKVEEIEVGGGPCRRRPIDQDAPQPHHKRQRQL